MNHYTFWQFAGDHPILDFFLVWLTWEGISSCVKCLSGYKEPEIADDE